MKPSAKLRKDHLMVYRHEGEPWYCSPDNGTNDNDHAWLHAFLTYGYGDSPLLTELERRGYDTSTLKFSVQLKPGARPIKNKE